MNDKTMSSKAVVLLNFGGPRSLEEVPSFLFEILRDPETIKLPIPQWCQDRLARRIARKRAPEVQSQYELLGGKSPLIEATERQQIELQNGLLAAGIDIPVYVAHRYLPFHAVELAKELVEKSFKELYLIPMYPHYCWSTTGSSVVQLQQALLQAGFTGKIEILHSYSNHPGYINALTDTIATTLEEAALHPSNTLLLCSAHGLPKSYVKQGDSYYLELHQTISALRQRLPKWKIELAFQSRVGPAQWLKPYTDQFIPTLPGRRIKNLVFIPISFVNDHLETLVEIQHLYFSMAQSVGLVPYRVPAIETHPAFIQLLVDQVDGWNQGVEGVSPEWVTPPSQQFQRHDRWIWLLWLMGFLIALHAAWMP